MKGSESSEREKSRNDCSMPSLFCYSARCSTQMTMKLTPYVVTTSSFNYIEILAPEMVTEFNQQDLTKNANNDNFKEDRKC
jgi:hypothetical protein